MATGHHRGRRVTSGCCPTQLSGCKGTPFIESFSQLWIWRLESSHGPEHLLRVPILPTRAGIRRPDGAGTRDGLVEDRFGPKKRLTSGAWVTIFFRSDWLRQGTSLSTKRSDSGKEVDQLPSPRILTTSSSIAACAECERTSLTYSMTGSVSIILQAHKAKLANRDLQCPARWVVNLNAVTTGWRRETCRSPPQVELPEPSYFTRTWNCESASLHAVDAGGEAQAHHRRVAGVVYMAMGSWLPPFSEHPNPTTKIEKMGGEFTYPKMVPLVLTHSHIVSKASPLGPISLGWDDV